MTALAAMLDRSVRWVLSGRAVRWSPSNPPSRDEVLGVFARARPRVYIGPDAVQSDDARGLARMAVRVLARTFPGAIVDLRGDNSFQKELDALVAEVLPSRHSADKIGPALVIGDWPKREPEMIFVGCKSWRAILSGSSVITNRTNAATALITASIGVSEVFKSTFRELLPRHAGRWTADDLAPGEQFDWNTSRFGTTQDAPVPPQLDLGHLLMVSGGALANAVLAVLLAQPGVRADVELLDGDRLDVTNLNRYLLLNWANAVTNAFKTDFLARNSSGGVRLRGKPEHYVDGHPRQRLVVVGADRLGARHAVARDGHDLVLNGASEEDLIRISLHRGDSDRACLGCLNPGEDEAPPEAAPTIAFVSTMAGGLLAAELLRHSMVHNGRGHVLDVHPLQPGRPGNIRFDQPTPNPGCRFCLGTKRREEGAPHVEGSIVQPR